MKINTSRTKVMKETCRAYADANMKGNAGYKLRNLNFRASVAVTPLDATQIMCAALACDPTVNAYNEFQPDALMRLPDDAQVILGRAGSVCVHFTTGTSVNTKKLQRAMKADEFDLVNSSTTFSKTSGMPTVAFEYRVWWD